MQPRTRVQLEIEDAMSRRQRAIEYYMAISMLTMGAILVIPGETLKSDAWRIMYDWVQIWPGNEWKFGMVVGLAGLTRLVALVINGRWFVTAPVRIGGCILGSFLWTSETVSFVGAAWRNDVPGVPSILAFTLTAVFFEWYSAVRAAEDAHYMDSFGLRTRRG